MAILAALILFGGCPIPGRYATDSNTSGCGFNLPVTRRRQHTFQQAGRSNRLSSARLAMLSAEMPASILALFEETGAYLRGHFHLTSGLHSGEYLQCAKVLSHPVYAERLGWELAEKIRPLLSGKVVSAVVSPAIGGIVIGHEVARALGGMALFTERDPASNQMTLRRGFEISRNEATVVIEDVITTGGSTRDVIQVLRDAGAGVLAAGSIIDRSNGRVDLGLPRVALETLDPVAYEPDQCPLCRQGVPVVKPGSRRV